MEFNLEDPFSGFCCYPSGEEEQHLFYSGEGGAHHQSDSISALFSAESDHMFSCKSLDFSLSLRRDAVSLLLQAQCDCNLDPMVTYLAINYVDRFLSRQEIPMDRPWIVRLLSTACLSLASKMNKTHFSTTDFQGGEEEEGFMIYEPQTIQRMELLVLGALGWRMRSVTPFSFLRLFLSLFRPQDPPLLAALKARATNIIFKAQNEVKILEYNPSVIAASALLTAAHELFPIQFPSFRNSISSCSSVNKEKVWECCDAMEDMIDGCDLTSEMLSSCDTPITVLGHRHRHCLSSSESERTTVGSDDVRYTKRRICGL